MGRLCDFVGGHLARDIAHRLADVVVADAPALAQVTAALQGAGSSLQPPLAPADTARPDQLTAAPVTAAPASTSLPPAADSAAGLPARPGLMPTPLDLLSAADLLGPEVTVPTSPPG